MKYNVRLCASTVKLKRYLSVKNVKEYFVLSKKKASWLRKQNTLA